MLRSFKPAGLLLFYVLWIYHPSPWNFGPLSMTPGWFSLVTYRESLTCEHARGLASAASGLKTKCLQDNVEPSPVARVIQ